MPSILALDQGTTGSTSLVIHRVGRVLGRGYREFTQHFPQPGWVEHDPDEISGSPSRPCGRRSPGRGKKPRRPGYHESTGNGGAVEPPNPRAGCSGHRVAGSADQRARCQRTAPTPASEEMLREHTGLVADPYFSATKLEWLLRDPEFRTRAARGELAAGTVGVGWWRSSPAAGFT